MNLNNKSEIISYSQNFEDIILWNVLSDLEKGFYIDVGAYHDEIDSVTKIFYENGWNGVNVEPIDTLYAEICKARPRDININLLASNNDQEQRFYENDSTGLSTTIESVKSTWENYDSINFTEKVKNSTTLNSIIKENNILNIDFLKIDTEGSEMNVLKGIDLKTHRPKIIVIEFVPPIGEGYTNSKACQEHLKNHDYQEVYFDGLNKFFLADEHSDLSHKFVAPLFTNFGVTRNHWIMQRSSFVQRLIKENNELREERPGTIQFCKLLFSLLKFFKKK